ncbi:hypothetical protein Syun_007373 [Stephania yunnanensis]|uniref:non-specific serine/threonine protein kinase n=1 Tax=Stephania yunnanensis TaxID=152371 RepID=A0AAP0PYG4_9MAGN
MNGLPIGDSSDCSDYVEVDPTGRYWRYNEILGKGASKTVYRAFDEFEGIEVAWNQVKLSDFLQSPEDLERLYCEIHLLKTLKHKHIMEFYTSWVDAANRNINFITEMFTSGTLKQYRERHKRVNIRALKHWCRQILKGLLYLHNHDPPVIHRDLKCDNIFINGNQGVVKIGDLGLAAIRRKSHVVHCVGTPEFMAPEVYEEEYNELVDIYSFGMCVLEMVTFEYPYSECTHPAQIYKKVISGKKPDALHKVKDPEVRRFVEKCLATVSQRLSAKELLEDPFLLTDDCGEDTRLIEYSSREIDRLGPIQSQPFFELHHRYNSFSNHSNVHCFEYENRWDYHLVDDEINRLNMLTYHEDEHSSNVDIAIKGTRREDDVFLSLRIADKEGRIRNIYFHFDIATDTALSVAAEMVSELDITDQDITRIADIIDGEIAALVPGWRIQQRLEETSHYASAVCCNYCGSDVSLVDYFDLNDLDGNCTQGMSCVQHCCGSATHGRFEELTYQVEESEEHMEEKTNFASCQTSGIRYLNGITQHEKTELGDQLPSWKRENVIHTGKVRSVHQLPFHGPPSMVSLSSSAATDEYEKEIKQELRWLKAKYQMQLRELRNDEVEGKSMAPSLSFSSRRKKSLLTCSPASTPTSEEEDMSNELLSFDLRKRFAHYLVQSQNNCPKLETRRVKQCGASVESFSPVNMFTAKSFYAGELLPNTLHRTTSLPVDAVEI